MALEWSDKLLTGKKEIDEQHKKFINYMTKLSEQIKTGADMNVIRETIETLTKYQKEHFDYEEKILSPAEKEKHEKYHTEFKTFFNEFLQKFKAAYNKPGLTSQKLTALLKKLSDKLQENYVKHLYHG